MDVRITELIKHADARGFLVEFLKGIELPPGQQAFGQIYLTTIEPGCLRGNHYHENSSEYFTVMQGRIRVVLESVATRERQELVLDAADNPLKRVYYGPYTAHALHNVSSRVVVVVSYATAMYDPTHIDRIPYLLIKP